MITKRSWLMLALGLTPLLSACGARAVVPQPLPVVAERRQCPQFPQPPRELMEEVKRTCFLPPCPG